MSYVVPFPQTPAGCALDGKQRWEIEVDGVRVGMQVSRSRSVPWLNHVRVPRFGRRMPTDIILPVVRTLAKLARERAVLRLSLELWSEGRRERDTLRSACRELDFRPVPAPRSYTRTIWIDLDGSEQELQARFHATCRRHIRAPEKKGYRVRPITDPEAAGPLERIFRETFRRTGGECPDLPWPEIIRLSSGEDSASHVVGLFREEDTSCHDPLSFALAVLHGDVAEYAHAGSIRDPSIRAPLLYAPTWELMRWARGRGARWWDFGGIVEGSARENDGRRGIRDFKRYFYPEACEVGEEWTLEPRRASSTLSGFARRVFRRPPR